MPTGYTANIENGQSFEEYALGCARAFGACILQRDDPVSDKPKLRTESTFSEARVLELGAELGAFVTMNHTQKITVGEELREEAIASAQKYLNSRIVLKSQYEAMMDKVQAWNPPTEQHVDLKRFMTDQINSSIDFDCNVSQAIEELDKKTKMAAMDYYNEKVASLEWQINYHEEELDKQLKRVDESNNWILELYKSLGIDYE